MQKFTLNDGNQIPALGFGTWKLTGNQCTESVEAALKVGYRHIDTAERYENQEYIHPAISDSNIPREELFITSKIWFTELHHDNLISECKKCLEQLDILYLDLLLIHWPNRQIPLEETLKGFSDLKEQGLIKSFGVSNATIHHLKDCIDIGFTPTVDQVELHPTFAQNELKTFCDANKIILTAYSPLGQGGEIELPEIVEIAKIYDKTPAQIILNWIVGRGIVAIPKSTNPQRIKENFESLDFKLKDEDIVKLNSLDRGNRILKAPWADFEY